MKQVVTDVDALNHTANVLTAVRKMIQNNHVRMTDREVAGVCTIIARAINVIDEVAGHLEEKTEAEAEKDGGDDPPFFLFEHTVNSDIPNGGKDK